MKVTENVIGFAVCTVFYLIVLIVKKGAKTSSGKQGVMIMVVGSSVITSSKFFSL